MTAIPSQNHRRYTLAEYLEFEESTPLKHEFHDGEILAMSGGSPEHALITANALRVIGNALAGKPCRVYSADLKVAIGAAPDVQYPDGSVVCGPLEFHPADSNRRLVTNPKLIVEVLSPSTEAYDRGEKFRRYRSLPSLQEYVLISQTAPIVETFLRQPDGRFVIAATYSGLEARAELSSLQIEIALSEIFSDVEFPEVPPRPAFDE
jgi:Uma2 family endonuclease